MCNKKKKITTAFPKSQRVKKEKSLTGFLTFLYSLKQKQFQREASYFLKTLLFLFFQTTWGTVLQIPKVHLTSILNHQPQKKSHRDLDIMNKGQRDYDQNLQLPSHFKLREKMITSFQNIINIFSIIQFLLNDPPLPYVSYIQIIEYHTECNHSQFQRQKHFFDR